MECLLTINPLPDGKLSASAMHAVATVHCACVSHRSNASVKISIFFGSIGGPAT